MGDVNVCGMVKDKAAGVPRMVRERPNLVWSLLGLRQFNTGEAPFKDVYIDG